MKGIASTFADPGDIDAFKRCRKRGHSEKHCLNEGDNGIGCWGDDTTGDQAFVALRKSFLVSMFGSLEKAKHREVILEYRGKLATALVGDIMSEHVSALIDLNPAACRALDLTPPDLFEDFRFYFA